MLREIILPIEYLLLFGNYFYPGVDFRLEVLFLSINRYSNETPKLIMLTSIALKYLSPSSLTLLVFLFITPSLSISHATTSLSGDKTNLRSASELDYPPFAIVHPNGTAGGFSVDLLAAAVHAAGLTVTFKVAPWNQIKEELARDELDVLPLVSYSAERDKIYDFTAPYLRMNGAVFVRKGYHEIKTISDLKGKEVLVMQGDTAH